MDWRINLMMHDENPMIYQVTATQSDGKTLRIKLSNRPLLIGSSNTAHLVLNGFDILPIHARLLLSTSGQVLLTNLGDEDSIRLQAEPVESFTPINWKPGARVTIGSYTLELDTLEITGTSVQREHVHPAAVTQDNEQIVPPSEVLIYWGEDEQEAAPGTWQLSNEDEVQPPAPPEVVTELPEVTSFPPPEDMLLPEMAEETGATTDEESAAEQPPQPPDWESTEVMPALPHEMVAADSHSQETRQHVPAGDGTLPKDWQTGGQLSAQISINPVYMAAGERVRVPVSIRNRGDQTAQVRLIVAGISRQWVEVKEVIELGPGETKSTELVLHIPQDVSAVSFDCGLRVYDRLNTDDYTLLLPFQIILKPQPILTGWLNPSEARFPENTILGLQNHTLADMDIFIAGHAPDDRVFVVPGHPLVQIPPGQVVQIPIQIRVEQRSWLRQRRARFSLSAAHSSRAPLDFPGVVLIPPRLPLNYILLTAAFVTILSIAFLLLTRPAQDTISIQQSPTATPTLTDVVLPSQPAALPSPGRSPVTTSIPTQKPSSTPTLTPTIPTATLVMEATGILPTPTPAYSVTATVPTVTANDPRPSGCVAPIPEGWQPYTVQPGDRVFRLAMDYGTTVTEITVVNCLPNPRLLQVGQILLLPGN